MSGSRESEVAKQKRLIQQEIAKLSGAISRHAGPSRPSSYASENRSHPYASSRGGPSRGRGRGRGGRGGGRGGSYALDLRQTNKPPSTTAPKSAPAPAATQEREEGEVSPEPPAASGSEDKKSTEKDKEDDPDNWVKRTSKGGNMSLMTVQKSNTLASKPKARIPRQPRIPPQIQVLNSTAGPSGANRVVIDGVIFQFEEGGGKLIRIGEVTPQASTSATGTPTRRSLDYGGQKFRRTSKGNLVAANRRAELAKKPCRYFTKTGRCNRALTCPFAHYASRVAICPKFLRSTCPNTASSCPLSHIPSPHNTPSCIHFQATASCRNGDACIYPHVKVADNAPVCELFARGGWCDRAAGTCPELHVWECGEWRAKGVCSKGGKCGLRHVLRAEKGKGKGKAEQEGLGEDQEMFTTDTEGERDAAAAATAGTVPVEGGFEEQDEFIVFDHGTPADPESDDDDAEDEGGSESSEEGSSADEGEDDSDVTVPVPDSGKHTRTSSPTPDMSEDEDEEDEDEVLGIVM